MDVFLRKLSTADRYDFKCPSDAAPTASQTFTLSTSPLTSNLDLVVGLLWWVRLLSPPFDFPLWMHPLQAPLKP